MHAQFQSISAQVAATLREQIGSGAMRVLPSERELSQKLQVSRRTIRKALSILRSDGLIKTEQRRTVALLARSGRLHEKGQVRVNLLLPETLLQSRPYTVLWISYLAELLRNNGCLFEIVSGKKYYGMRAARSIARLVADNPAQCWVLARTNQPLQQWFNDRDIPAIVAGSTYASITLPSVDTDHRALGHHAAATFLRHGHRRLALFFEKLCHAGDVETELGFKSAMARDPDAQEPLVCRVERTPSAVIREVKRMLALESPPTGFMFCNALLYLPAHGYLTSLGYRLPRDFSLMAQDEGMFFGHVYPAPARYTVSAKKFAVSLNRAIKQMLEGYIEPGFKIRIMPDFIIGASIARINS